MSLDKSPHYDVLVPAIPTACNGCYEIGRQEVKITANVGIDK